MYDLAHACPLCRTVTIFSADASYPRRCGRCDHVIRAASGTRFVARPVLDDDDDDDIERFELELGPERMEASPF